jgi:hypothetical protein
LSLDQAKLDSVQACHYAYGAQSSVNKLTIVSTKTEYSYKDGLLLDLNKHLLDAYIDSLGFIYVCPS